MVPDYWSHRWAEPGSLEAHLREVLPEGYIPLADLTIHGCQLDAVVVGPQGLFVVHAPDWAPDMGEGTRPSQTNSESGQSSAGWRERRFHPSREADHATRALRGFLRDEFPALQPAIHNMLVVTKLEAD